MHETEEIKARLPIEQVVGRYVSLKRAGRVFKALCPFHTERTPSFTVNPERGIYKCFGCGEGGDIFDFTMKIEGLTFPETLQLLAEQAGVKLEERPGSTPAEKGPRRERLLAVNAYVAKLWHTILTQHPKAEVAREYLSKRGLTPESLTRFQIGYAPLGDVTRSSLQNIAFSREEVQAAGDPTKFADRITFPIADITGRTIAFTGRLLESSNDPKGSASRGPKYWNTPETALFSKSRAVFALHLAKAAIQEQDVAILAEGQMDVVMLHQHGFQNAVASSGTALTTQQLQLISRFSLNIAFAYDGDTAGTSATKKGIELCLDAELNPYVIPLPTGSDPADLLLRDHSAWEAAYTARLPFMEWLLNTLIAGETLSPQRKKEVAREIIPWLARFRDPVEQSEWVRIAAGRLQTDESNLRIALERAAHPTAARPKPASEETPTFLKPAELSPLLSLAELGASLLLTFPALYETVTTISLGDLRLAGTTPFLESFLTHSNPTEPGNRNLTEQLARIPEAERKALYLHVEERLKPYNDTGLDSAKALEEIMLIMQRLRSDSREASKTHIAREIQAAQLSGDHAKVKELFGQLQGML